MSIHNRVPSIRDGEFEIAIGPATFSVNVTRIKDRAFKCGHARGPQEARRVAVQLLDQFECDSFFGKSE